jgi:hypothetical protein
MPTGWTCGSRSTRSCASAPTRTGRRSGCNGGKVSYDEETATRVRKVLSGRRDVVEKKMMGGLSFMADGAMFCSELTNESGANFDWEYCCQQRNV